jgi:hypothetical protein
MAEKNGGAVEKIQAAEAQRRELERRRRYGGKDK